MLKGPNIISIEKRSISEQVFLNIKKMILMGEIKVGERIQEDKISKQFGVSRTPIREALKKLENYGLIVVKPRSFAEVITISDREMESIIAVRANMECFAVKLASERSRIMDEETICTLQKSVKECDSSLLTKNPSDIFEKDSVFHLELAKSTGNHYVYEILEKLDAKIQLYRLLKCITFDKIEKAVHQHSKILDAVLCGNAEEAAKLMEKHILSN